MVLQETLEGLHRVNQIVSCLVGIQVPAEMLGYLHDGGVIDTVIELKDNAIVEITVYLGEEFDP